MLICYDKYHKITTVEYQEYPKILDEKILLDSEVVHINFDTNSKDKNTKYLIRYETLNTNRDIQSDKKISPSPLLFYQLNR